MIIENRTIPDDCVSHRFPNINLHAFFNPPQVLSYLFLCIFILIRIHSFRSKLIHKYLGNSIICDFLNGVLQGLAMIIIAVPITAFIADPSIDVLRYNMYRPSKVVGFEVNIAADISLITKKGPTPVLVAGPIINAEHDQDLYQTIYNDAIDIVDNFGDIIDGFDDYYSLPSLKLIYDFLVTFDSIDGGPNYSDIRNIYGRYYDDNSVDYYDNYTFGCINRISSGYFIRKNSMISGGSCCRGAIVIDRSVSSIGFQAFTGSFTGSYISFWKQQCNIESVIMHDNVTYIDTYAFDGNEKLSNVKFSSNLAVIGTKAFMNTGLTSIDLPNSLIEVRTSAFYNSNLKELVIPDSVTTIGPRAFEANNLTSVKLSSSLKYIGWGAFSDNQHLKRVVIPKSVEIIGNFAFNENDENFCLVYEGKVFQYPRCKHSSSASSWYMAIIDYSILFFKNSIVLLFFCLFIIEIFCLLRKNYYDRSGSAVRTTTLKTIFGDNNHLRVLFIVGGLIIINITCAYNPFV